MMANDRTTNKCNGNRRRLSGGGNSGVILEGDGEERLFSKTTNGWIFEKLRLKFLKQYDQFSQENKQKFKV